MHSGSTVPSTPDCTPVKIRVPVPQDAMDDLRRRLASTRFPPDPHNDDSDYRFPTADPCELVHHWLHGHDWRATEERMNALEQ